MDEENEDCREYDADPLRGLDWISSSPSLSLSPQKIGEEQKGKGEL